MKLARIEIVINEKDNMTDVKQFNAALDALDALEDEIKQLLPQLIAKHPELKGKVTIEIASN